MRNEATKSLNLKRKIYPRNAPSENVCLRGAWEDGERQRKRQQDVSEGLGGALGDNDNLLSLTSIRPGGMALIDEALCESCRDGEMPPGPLHPGVHAGEALVQG